MDFSGEWTDLSAEMVALAGTVGTPVKEMAAHDRMELGRYCTLTILHPQPGTPSVGVGTDDLNAHSLVVRVDCSSFSFLVAGDADAATEETLLEVEAPLSVDVLRVSHHGSAYSSSEAFLKAVSARIAVISVGPNVYGHPSPSTLERLAAAGCDVRRTDREGALVVEVRGGVARMESWCKGVRNGEVG